MPSCLPLPATSTVPRICAVTDPLGRSHGRERPLRSFRSLARVIKAARADGGPRSCIATEFRLEIFEVQREVQDVDSGRLAAGVNFPPGDRIDFFLALRLTACLSPYPFSLRI
jgi:hypothetical protein